MASLLLNVAKIRMKKGEKKYGKFDPTTDTRDFLREFVDEIADAYNYIWMYARQLESKKILADKANKMARAIADILLDLGVLATKLKEVCDVKKENK